ncbi:MAG: hypothetical protein U0944_03065 [Candidatus Moranbacteria bacterium]|nr:hypothetical protein [Candidatus Moranbacteria bacterium]MDZ4385375.1 hypothetical protein [Candidatus Moranbacteria bacterium]
MGRMKKVASRKKINQVPVKKESKPILFLRWSAAVLAGLLFLFIGEIFSENFQWSHFLPALMPGSAYLLMAYAAWRDARIGGMLFIIAGTGLVLVDIAQDRDVLGMHILALITFILGCLFLIFRKR